MKTPRTDEDIASFLRRLRVDAPRPCGPVTVVPPVDCTNGERPFQTSENVRHAARRRDERMKR